MKTFAATGRPTVLRADVSGVAHGSARPDEAPPAALSVRHATVGYAGRPVVVDADLTVAAGEVVALVGANGSGKTTLVRGIVGLADLLAGDIEVAGRSVTTRIARDSVRIGYVPQRSATTAGIPTTAGEVVSAGLLARRRLLAAGPGARLRVRAALAEIGLPTHASTPFHQLSGGQQRRVLIARALVARPEVLVLDEPTAGVDNDGVLSLVDTLAGLKAAGRSLLVVTHELAAFGAVVDRTVTMRHGQLSAGSPAAADVAGSH